MFRHSYDPRACLATAFYVVAWPSTDYTYTVCPTAGLAAIPGDALTTHAVRLGVLRILLATALEFWRWLSRLLLGRVISHSRCGGMTVGFCWSCSFDLGLL